MMMTKTFVHDNRSAYDADMLIVLLLQVVLDIPPLRTVSPGIARAAVAEAADLWRPYGVEVTRAGGGDLRSVLTVVPIEARQSVGMPARRPALGAITFKRDGAPVPSITLYVADIEQFVADAHVLGGFGRFWPPVLREQLLGRVLGRILAHEIGHHVLRSPRHTVDGLMRPLQFADDLVAPSRHRFTLTMADAARLAALR
jgi:hypothetical protein